MSIPMTCACGKTLKLKDEFAGRKVKCPSCGQTIAVPKSQTDEDSLPDSWEETDPATKVPSPPGRTKSGRGGPRRADKGSQPSRGLLIGLAAGGGVFVVVLLAWLFWPKPATPTVAVAPDALPSASTPTAASELANSASPAARDQAPDGVPDTDTAIPANTPVNAPVTLSTEIPPLAPFDQAAWAAASDRLKSFRGAKAVLLNKNDIGPGFPEELTNVVMIDLPPGSGISKQLWEPISSISHILVRQDSMNDRALEKLATHPGLIGVNISGKSSVTAAGIANLENVPHLFALHLSEVPLSQGVPETIARLAQLRMLGVGKVPVSDEAVAVIAQMSELVSLTAR